MIYNERNPEAEVLGYELSSARQTIVSLRMERDAAKAIAVKHLAELEECKAEIRALRDAVRQLSADVAHYASFGPVVPAYPKAMVTSGNG